LAHLVEELDCIIADSKNGKVLMNLVDTHRYCRGTMYSLLDNMVKNLGVKVSSREIKFCYFKNFRMKA
jgi:hypothetical protein